MVDEKVCPAGNHVHCIAFWVAICDVGEVDDSLGVPCLDTP